MQILLSASLNVMIPWTMAEYSARETYNYLKFTEINVYFTTGLLHNYYVRCEVVC